MAELLTPEERLKVAEDRCELAVARDPDWERHQVGNESSACFGCVLEVIREAEDAAVEKYARLVAAAREIAAGPSNSNVVRWHHLDNLRAAVAEIGGNDVG